MGEIYPPEVIPVVNGFLDLNANDQRIAAGGILHKQRLGDNPESNSANNHRRDHAKSSFSMEELFDMETTDPKFTVPGVIPVGLGIATGRPKCGKSVLALQIAHGVGTGGNVLGIKVSQGKVLYLALEDSPRRLKERAAKQGIPRKAQITFVTEWQPLDKGGLIDLQNEIYRCQYNLVVIDTLSRLLGRADQMDLGEMTSILGSLQRVALDREMTILAIDHQRKNNGFVGNPIDDLLGSTAKSAVADFVLALYRERGKRETVLKVIGRDIEEREFILERDPDTCTWQNLGNADDVRENTRKSDVVRAIKELGQEGEVATTAKIAKHLDLDRGQVSRLLADLWVAGKVLKGEKIGKDQPYELPLNK
jgi:RecA-family ATPase